MKDSEIRDLIDISLGLARKHNSRLLIGVLKSNTSETLEGISKWLSILKQRSGENNTIEAMKSAGVCGFTVCPPRGSKLTQEDIGHELEAVLKPGIPIVLYQLPQVTENEMSPSLVAGLADHYANLILVKDSSGGDRIALNNDDNKLPFLLRGAEGNYAQWLRESGGPYHGLLLSSANCFPRKLKKIITLLENGHCNKAADLSDSLTRVIEQVFALVSNIKKGNAFTNANKALDHYMAFGKDARTIRPPILHAGIYIPEDVIQKVGDLLESAGLIPDKGYNSIIYKSCINQGEKLENCI